MAAVTPGAALLPAGLADWLDAHAETLDTDTALASEVVPRLAGAGLFGIGVPARYGGSGGTVADAIAAIAAVAERSLTAAFVFWGQRAFIEFLLQGDNQALRARWTADLVAGGRAGATGLSNAMKFLSGIESLRIAATRADDGWRIDGGIAWITNLRKEGFMAAAAADMPDGAPPAVIAFTDDAPGVVRSPDLDLLALRGSNTASVTLSGVRIGEAAIVAADAHAWLPAVRPAFLGMQCGLSIGLARAALGAAQALSGRMAGPLPPRIEAARVALEGQEATLAEGVLDGRFASNAPDLFRLRIALAASVQQAVMLELQASGGKAYLRQHDGFARRWREAAFIPIVTPSLTQLQAALDKLDAR
ncbi:acyl-CoA dehydrogenase family protein [Massilia sp. TN1-12]|uniref:acyl-CoA dehydrogenase family protein n=1 Tax=Massilia paldalensis TaxID=3377675 RepID=UPI00384FA14B